jgi:predicted amino acid dehydrogenase
VPPAPDARFVFLVHPFTGPVRRLAALRTARPRLGLARRPSPRLDDARPICRLVLEASDRLIEGVVVTVPLLPDELLDDQEAALTMMRAAVARAGGAVDVVGLGSLLAVVAGRGTALQAQLWQPVTTGAAATAWAASENAMAAARGLGVWPHGPIAVLGHRGTVGSAVIQLLQEAGAQKLRVAARGGQARRAEGQGLRPFEDETRAVEGCPVVVGASTTGGILSPRALTTGAVLVDVAIPRTLDGPPRRGTRVLAGEAVLPPPSYRRGAWGALYHLLAGYGPEHLFACLAEPLIMAAEGRERPFGQGRRVTPEALRDIRRLAPAWGFVPVLASRWRSVPPQRLRLRSIS